VKLVYSEQAVADLVRLRAFIAEHDPSAASRIAKELVDRLEHLRLFPAMGRRVEQSPDPEAIRDVVFGKYIVRYLVHGESIAVLRVWHHYEQRADHHRA
jgi:plasmid stabilization system protein ParE